ncbi:MAG: hypothetical protein P8M80_02980, partial [Pirellulaceae bacterium]|nr:hypothetical protein [Pirellulaceae bacterium]
WMKKEISPRKPSSGPRPTVKQWHDSQGCCKAPFLNGCQTFFRLVPVATTEVLSAEDGRYTPLYLYSLYSPRIASNGYVGFSRCSRNDLRNFLKYYPRY